MFEDIFLLFPVPVQRLLLQRGEPAAGCADPAHGPAHLPVHPPQRDAEPVQLLQLPQPVPRALGAGRHPRRQGRQGGLRR